MYRKGDQVDYRPADGAELLGWILVDQASPTADVRVRLSDGRTGSIPARRVSPSAAPSFPRVSKGDRVEFLLSGELMHGVVEKGGESPNVVLDGGLHSIKGHFSEFKASDFPLPSDPPGPIDRWTVVKYKEVPSLSEETTCFSCEIRFDGRPAFRADNIGHGGCNSYRRLSSAPQEATRARLLEDATEWFLLHDPEGRPFEPEDEWLAWTATQRPYGVTGAMHAERRREFMSRITDVEEAAGPGPRR